MCMFVQVKVIGGKLDDKPKVSGSMARSYIASDK